MQDKEPNLVTSSFSGHRSENGVPIELCIYRLEHSPEWTLEVVLSDGTSVVWDDVFGSDIEAHEEFRRTIDEEGMTALIGNVVQFPGN